MVAVRGVVVVVVVVVAAVVVAAVLEVLGVSDEREDVGTEEGEPEVLEMWVGGGSRVSEVVAVEVGAVAMMGVVVGVVLLDGVVGSTSKSLAVRFGVGNRGRSLRDTYLGLLDALASIFVLVLLGV